MTAGPRSIHQFRQRMRDRNDEAAELSRLDRERGSFHTRSRRTFILLFSKREIYNRQLCQEKVPGSNPDRMEVAFSQDVCGFTPDSLCPETCTFRSVGKSELSLKRGHWALKAIKAKNFEIQLKVPSRGLRLKSRGWQ